MRVGRAFFSGPSLMSFLRSVAAALCVAAVLPAPAQAYTVSPVAATLRTAGPQMATRFQVLNNDAGPLDAEFKMYRIEVDDAGAMKLVPADKDFFVFPPQASIPQGRTQAVQIRWAGAEALSAMYFLQVQQTNVLEATTIDSGQTQIGLNLVQYQRAWVAVAPLNAKSQIAVDGDVQREGDAYTFRVVNRGPALGFLDSRKWSAVIDGAKTPIDPKLLSYGQANFVPPGGTRVVRLPVSAFAKQPAIVVD
jgi:P pilus assembly chaperone PapD